MVYDDLDFFILKKIYFSKNITTWEIAKSFFSNLNLNTKKGVRELEGKHELIKYRLKRMSKLGLIFITKNDKGKNEYILIKDNVKFTKHKFPNGYKEAIMIKEKEKWVIFELSTPPVKTGGLQANHVRSLSRKKERVIKRI